VKRERFEVSVCGTGVGFIMDARPIRNARGGRSTNPVVKPMSVRRGDRAASSSRGTGVRGVSARIDKTPTSAAGNQPPEHQPLANGGRLRFPRGFGDAERQSGSGLALDQLSADLNPETERNLRQTQVRGQIELARGP